MKIFKKHDEARKLIKVKVLYDGNRGWTLNWNEGANFKVFHGSTEDFVKLLIKMKAKENKEITRSIRTLKYSEIVDQITNGLDRHFWVWSTDLDNLS